MKSVQGTSGTSVPITLDTGCKEGIVIDRVYIAPRSIIFVQVSHKKAVDKPLHWVIQR